MLNKNRLWPQRLIWVVLLITITFFSSRVYYRLTDDFRIANMTYELPYNTDWEIEPLTHSEKENLHSILSQPFYYIGKGAQSYAFMSEDKKHVIKFFKFKHLRPNWFEKLVANVSLFEEYKANRAETPDELIQQIPKIKEFVKLMQIPIYEMEGFEADDVLATLAKQAEQQDEGGDREF